MSLSPPTLISVLPYMENRSLSSNVHHMLSGLCCLGGIDIYSRKWVYIIQTSLSILLWHLKWFVEWISGLSHDFWSVAWPFWAVPINGLMGTGIRNSHSKFYLQDLIKECKYLAFSMTFEVLHDLLSGSDKWLHGNGYVEHPGWPFCGRFW